jgi:DNA-directed RNA polymerase subunit RPC12/RpoP
MQLITLKSFDTAIEARIIQNRLESEGIICHIFDENLVTLNPLLNFAVGGIRLQVNLEDAERAQSILSEIEGTALTDEQNNVIACPNCQSTELYTDFKSMKDAKGVLAMIAAFVFSVFPMYSKSVYKCKSCATEFEKK